MEQFHFHPMVVHFPIALYFFEFLLLCLWTIKKDSAYKRFAFLSFKVGYILMIGAMIAGYVDAGGITPPVQKHFFAALSVFTVYSIRGLFWLKGKEAAPNYQLTLVLGALLGVILVSITGDLGGDLVFSS